jgi:argininosuccinate lyase
MEQASATVTQRLWGARFKSEPSAALKALSRSDPSFFRLVPYDLAGSRAHARELQRAGILQAAELAQLLTTIDQLEREFLAGELQPSDADEDVHTFLERVLTLRLGAIGGKLRAGR